MASKEELSEQLAITTKLNTVVSQMAATLSRIESSYENQTTQIEKIKTAINQLDTERVVQEINGLTDKVGDLVKSLTGVADEGGKSMQKVVEEASKAGRSATSLTGKMKDAAASVSGVGKAAPDVLGVKDVFTALLDEAEQFIGSNKKLEKMLGGRLPKSILITVAAFSGLSQGIKNVVAMTRAIGGFVSTFVSGLTSIAAAIIAIPLKIFTGLIDMAANASHGSNELLQAIEDLRKAFGDLRGPTNKTITQLSTSLKGFSDTGLSTFRVFGYLHERLRDLRELVSELGGTFHLVEQELKDNGGAILAYQKGLGIANEEMGEIILRAKGMGVETKDVLNSMTKQTLNLGNAFGISQKVIGKDMAKAMKNVAKFGGLAVKEIGQASVYARKLGLELEKITGALDYDNFEEASDAVSQLSQRFGTTIDTFKLLEEENPAKRIDMVKKALEAAGHDAATFNRHDLKLVASLAKVDEAAAKAAFSVNNQGVAMQDIQKESENAEAQQLSQAEAMQKLAASIERLVKTGGGQTGGFWDMFVKGIMSGLQYSREFRTVIWNIKKGLYSVFRIGLQLGRILPKIIPDLGKTLGGIGEFFDPKKFSKLFGGISKIVRQFFDPKSSDKGNVPMLLEKLKENLESFFTSQGPAAKKILDGVKGLMKMMSGIVADIIPVVIEHVAKGLNFIADLIRGTVDLRGAANAGGQGLGFLSDLILPIWDALANSAPVLWQAIKDLWKAAWPRIKKGLITIAKDAGPWIAGLLFGPTLARSALTAITTSITTALIGGVKSALKSSAVKGAIKGATDGIAKKVAESAAGGSTAAAVSQAGKTAAAAAAASGQMGKVNWGKFGMQMAFMAGALAMGLAAYWLALKVSEGKKREEIINGGLAMGIALSTAAAAAGLAAVVEKALRKVDWKSLAVGLAAVGVTTIALAGVSYLIMKMLGSFDPGKMAGAGKLMSQMSLVFLSMIPLILGATAVGAAIVGTGGAVLVAAVAGFGVLRTAVAGLAEVAKEIVEKLSSTLQVDSGFQMKIDAFLSIMKAIQAMADTLVSMIKMMMPTFTEWITGKASKFTAKVESATKLMDSMIGTKGSGQGLIGLVEVILRAVKDLGGNDKKLGPGVEIFAGILETVGTILQAMTPPEAFYEAGSGFIKQITSHAPFDDVAVSAGYYMNQMRDGIMLMLTGSRDGSGNKGLLGVLKSATEIDIPNVETSKIVVQLLSAMSEILKNLIPKPEVIQAFQTTQKTKLLWGAISESISYVDSNAITNTINAMGNQIEKMMPALKETMASVVEQAKSLDPKRLKAVAVIGDILSAVSNIAAAIAGSLTGSSKVKTVAKDGSWKETIKWAPDLAKALDGVKDSLPKLVTSIIDVTKIPGLADAAKDLKIVKQVFKIIGTLSNLVTPFQKGGAKGSKIDSNAIMDAISEADTSFGRLVDDFGRNPLEELLKKLATVGMTIKKQGGGENAKMIGSDLTAVFASIGSMIKRVGSVTASTKKMIENDGLGSALKAVDEMVKSANELNSALADGNLNKIAISANLRKIGKAVGLGGKANYTIKNKGVTINIDMTVKMNADDLERAMVLRASSIIRDRINFAGNKPDDKFAALPDNPSSPVPLASSLDKAGP